MEQPKIQAITVASVPSIFKGINVDFWKLM
jgi:hypothetical protein